MTRDRSAPTPSTEAQAIRTWCRFALMSMVLLQGGACAATSGPETNAGTPSATVQIQAVETICPKIMKPLKAAEAALDKVVKKKGDLTQVPSTAFSEPRTDLQELKPTTPTELTSQLEQIDAFLEKIVAAYSGASANLSPADFYESYYAIEDTCKDATAAKYPDGRYVVGVDIEPGEYVATPPVGGCFWERLDSSGETIDNDFTNGARVAVTIEKDDYTFNSTGCGTWIKQ